jgi:ectoine hydroxylase-related dioxygenase (phytanoyl-CoA dioxygenase family)
MIGTLHLDQVNHYLKYGWVGPFTILSESDVSEITNLYCSNKGRFISGKEISLKNETDIFEEKPWFKSIHSVLPEFLDIATNSKLVEILRSLMGEDILLWGSSVTTKIPGQRHRWHVDVEHKKWKGITVFVGLEGTTKNSSLTVLTGSHKMDQMPQSLSLDTDSSVLEYCNKLNPNGQIISIELDEGECFIFDGLLWHCSLNETANNRSALILQYCTPDNTIQIPLNWDEPIRWSNFSPPCVIVSGEDRYRNNKLIRRP